MGAYYPERHLCVSLAIVIVTKTVRGVNVKITMVAIGFAHKVFQGLR